MLVARSDTDIAVQIRRSLEAVGRTATTKVTAFTDGCPGLRSILADAGVTHAAVRGLVPLSPCGCSARAKLAASGLLTDEPGRTEGQGHDRHGGRAAALAHLERQGQNAQKTFDRIRKVMHLYKGERAVIEPGGVASRKLWHALHEIDQYLRSQSARLVNYAARYRAGMLRVRDCGDRRARRISWSIAG